MPVDAGSYAVANFLLDQGANPRLQDWWGRTALYIAIDMHSRGEPLPVMALLAVAAADPAARGGRRVAGRQAAVGPGQRLAGPAAGPPGSAQYSAIQVARRLLEMGVDPNTQLDMHGRSWAASSMIC